MKSQINLYHREFQPTFEIYSFQNLLMLSGLCIVILAGTFAFADYGKTQSTMRFEEAKNDQQRLQNEITEITTGLQSRAGDPVLLAKLSEIKGDMATQRKLVEKIQSLSGLKSKSFSGLFDAFSNNHAHQLWLTRFAVNENDLTISGQFSEPKTLPNWIASLNQSEYFAGQEFSDAIVEREDNILRFQLTSKQIKSVARSQRQNDKGVSDNGSK